MPTINIGGRKVGPGHPCLIVAELGANCISLEHALETIKAAKRAGAEAIKTQTYKADSLTIRSDAPPFRVNWQGKETTLYDLYSQAAMPWEWQPMLKEYAESLGMLWFSTPFDFEAVDFLDSLGVPCFKIASFECNDLHFIRYAASKKRPLIISTGMADGEEIDRAIGACRAVGNKQIILLKCTSAYPASVKKANLRIIARMRDRWYDEKRLTFRQWDVLPGLSDHTLSLAVPVTAVALGACLIEKHFTLDSLGGPDDAFSLEPAEFRDMVEAVRESEAALGQVRFGPTEQEQAMLAYRRSLFVIADMKKGDEYTRDNVRSIRPAAGLPPRHYDTVLGKHAATDITRGTPLAWALITD